MNNLDRVLPAIWHLHYTLMVDWEIGAAVAELFGMQGIEPDDSITAVYSATLAEGAMIEVRFTEADIQFWILAGDWKCLGVCSAASNLPAFRVEEVIAIAASMEGAESARASLLLLLAPACDDASFVLTRDFENELTDAWRVVAPDGSADLIGKIVSATVSDRAAWTFDGLLGWVNDSPHSPRNPRRNNAMAREAFIELKRFWERIGNPKSHFPSLERNCSFKNRMLSRAMSWGPGR